MNDPSFITIGPEEPKPTDADINCEDLAGFDFGEVDAGTCGLEHTWTVTNEGGAVLTGTITLAGADAGEFEFTQGDGAFALDPDQSLTVGVQFCPTSTGAKNATLRITSNDPDENPCDLPLSGTGTGEPDINCEDLAGFDFGDMTVPDCTLEHTWIIGNEGTAILSGTVSLSGGDAAEFGFTLGEGGFDLGPGETHTVGVQFCPVTEGSKSATLHIESNDPDENPCDLAISGVGLPPGEPEINCEELSGFDYGAVPATTCGAEHIWVIINYGTASLVGTVTLTGDDAEEFEFTQGGGEFNLSPGGEHTVGVRFCPDTLGDKVATLEISSNDADENPCTLALSGLGKECAAVRDLTTLWPSYCGDDPKPIEIDIVAPPEAWAIGLEDQPPTDWVVSDISDSGVWDDINQKVKWGPFYEPFPTQVSYTVTPPPDAEGEHCFVGVISINGGANEEICGNACVDGPLGAFIPADQLQPPCTGCGDCSCATCGDGRVEVCEMIGYACAWKRGCNDDMAGVTRSAYIWWGGECYCWDGVDENWYLTACPPLPPLCCVGREAGSVPGRGGSAARELPESVIAETWFAVLITIEPPPEVSVVALEDQPPAGWLVREISDGGAWDETHGKVKWGPYFAPSIPSQVSYELLPPAGETGEHCFIGTISFDGDNQPISGDACLQVGISGDLNCDGAVNAFDIDPFVLALLSTPPEHAEYYAEYPDCNVMLADIDGSGHVDGFDIDPFVELLTGG